MDSVSEGGAIIKGTESLPLGRAGPFCDAARSQNLCGFREIKGRKEKVQWLIVPRRTLPRFGKEFLSVSSSPSPLFSLYQFFFSSILASRAHPWKYIGHMVYTRIHLHPEGSRKFSLPRVCHLRVTPRARSQEDCQVRGKTFYRRSSTFNHTPRFPRSRNKKNVIDIDNVRIDINFDSSRSVRIILLNQDTTNDMLF